MSEWVGKTAVDIAEAVRSRQVTATEIALEHIDHIAKVEPRVGAFEVVMREQALADARALDAREDLSTLLLAGVPMGIKDVVDIAGLPTRKGSVVVTTPPAEKDDVLVAALRREGAVIVGKTRCPELCFAATSDNASGVARNPWDLTKISGGSSGGSAAAIAAGMVPLALGSDGGGSVRLPSAACGVFGIKPGGDVVPRGDHGLGSNWHGLSAFGPMGTTVADVALMLDVLASADQYAQDYLPTGKLRVATSSRALFPIPIDRDVRTVWQKAIGELASAGHAVAKANPTYPFWLSGAIAQRSFQGGVFDAERLGLDELNAGRRTKDVLKRGRAMARKGPVDPAPAARWKALAATFFEEHDVLLTPATGKPAFRQQDFHNMSLVRGLPSTLRFAAFTSPWNLAEFPAAAVPVGMSRSGLPIAVQVVAGAGREDLVLQVALALESAMPWARHAPRWVAAA